MSTQTHHRTATVDGRKIFYREAGDPAAPTILLLHGLPTSSQMFRDLIPKLADRFHLVAPDYVGFGHSDAPSRDAFTYSFDNPAAHVAGLVDVLGLTDYILYMQDYGGPVGFRLFTQRPEKVTGFIIQNTNAYMVGVGDAPKSVLLPLWEKRTPETEKPAREFVSLDGTKFHWLVGAKTPEAINPDNWVLDQALLDRPGVQDCQVDLLENYKTNIALYPEWQAAFRAHTPKTLIVWGKHDPFFIQPGARAYLDDLPEAKLVWLDAGHFVLDENAAQVAAEIKTVFAVPTSAPIDIVTSFYDALGRGDAPAALGLLSSDMEWSVVAGWPYKPAGRGPQAVAEGVLMPVLKEWRDYALHASDMFAAGDKVVSLGVMTGVHTVTGKPLEAAYVHVWEVADGRIVRMRQTVDTAKVLEART